MTLETILRESRYVSPLAGSLRASILDAAKALGWEPAPFVRLKPTPEPRREFDPERALPVWRRRRNNHGQGLVEYALILALIVILAVIAIAFIGGQLSSSLSSIGESL